MQPLMLDNRTAGQERGERRQAGYRISIPGCISWTFWVIVSEASIAYPRSFVFNVDTECLTVNVPSQSRNAMATENLKREEKSRTIPSFCYL